MTPDQHSEEDAPKTACLLSNAEEISFNTSDVDEPDYDSQDGEILR